MQQQFYIGQDNSKEGPHDLVTLMRRIRMRKIGRSTPIYMGDDSQPVPAASIPELAMLFDRHDTVFSPARTRPPPSLTGLIAHGWTFTRDNHVMTVFAGGLLLLSLMLGSSFVAFLGVVKGGIAAWCVFVLLHNIYLLAVLRLYRGQTLGSDYVNRYLAPVLVPLCIASFILALMMAGGWMLLLIPGMIVAVYYIFVPFLIFDRRYRLVEAMEASRLLLHKNGKDYVEPIALLVVVHVCCLLLIIPIPITLPVFSAAIAQLYEELSAP